MQAMTLNADLSHYYHAEHPVSAPDIRDHGRIDDELLPQKYLKRESAEQKEITRHAYYFKFADDARARLESRGLWMETSPGSGRFEARPDAGERLATSFSRFLGSFINFGSTNEVTRPADVCSGLVHCTQGGMSPVTAIAGTIFIFNTIVAQLKKAFPAQKSHLDQAGRLTYFSASAVHSLVSAVQPIVQEASRSHADPIFSIVMVSLELLLGFYSTVTATESALARGNSRSSLLGELINARDKAASFFQKVQASTPVSPEEAEAYGQFMAVIGKLDQVAGEARFASAVSAAATAKEWLWFGGAVAGNETAYKQLASTKIAVNNLELVGTAVAEMTMALVANVLDLVHGIVVVARCQQRIDHGVALGKQIAAAFREMTMPEMALLAKGVAGMLGKKIQDERYEQGFSFFRIFKAAVFIAIGIAAIAAIALSIVYAAPLIIGLTAGIVLAAFFTFLIARSVRAADLVRREKKEEEDFNKYQSVPGNRMVDPFGNLSQNPENKFFLLHALSTSLVATPDTAGKEAERDALFTALNFNEIDMALLKSLARSSDTHEKNIEMVTAQLTRMLALKFSGA